MNGLLEFALIVSPGGALMFFVIKFIRSHAHVSVARTQTARAEALREAAQIASEVAGETAREAMFQTREALSIARTIGVVDAKIDYIVSAINGDPHPARRPQIGRHKRELPSGE